ncbi:hypothetical protein BGX21_008477 [Mortierella sp. AD011]|nr:hypothetical protein BGX20_000430 [Mortierella sp. AD010]KAF9397819.1 hypothetical protein BGX21_008477 [Mortierella sp. AD011]
MSNQPLFYAVGFGIFFIALLFCHNLTSHDWFSLSHKAYDINNGIIYYPLAMFLGYKVSMAAFLYVFPTAFDPAPPPEPKTRQEKKKAAKEAEAEAKRNVKMARKEADAARKAAEARLLD